MSTISPVSVTQNTSAVTTRSTSQSTTSQSMSQALTGLNLSPSDFLQMFTAQIANQDPLNPMDQSTFLNQIAQMTSVATMTDLDSTLTKFSGTMSSVLNVQQVSEATTFLGKNVQYTDGSGNTQQGTVSAIQIGSDGTPQLLVNGNTVGLSSVQQVLQ